MKRRLLVILILALFYALVLSSVSTKSPVCDEAGHHIGSGYSFIKTGDFRMNPSAPPLLRILMGLPLLSLDLKLPTDHPSWQTINSTEFNYNFLFVYNHNAGVIVFLSRLPMILLSVYLGFLVFFWAQKLYGYRSGLTALFLYVFSPTILGNAGLAMLDAGCACFMFLAVFQLYRYFKDRSILNLVFTGICLGLALSTKITAVLLLPLYLVFFTCDAFLRRDSLKHPFRKTILVLLAIGMIGFFVLWGTYFFEFKPLLRNAPDVEEKIAYIEQFSGFIPFVASSRVSRFFVNFASNVPIPLSTYLVSFLGVFKSVAAGDQGLFFMGRELVQGSKIYYLVDFLIKTPIPTLIALILSLFFIKRRTKTDSLTSLLLVLPALTIFLSASFSKLQGGLRYILPVYPFLFVWLSDMVNINLGKLKKLFQVFLAILGAGYFLSSVSTYPHYLAYFNALVGGPGGRGYTITADLDWGQDFQALKEYMDERGIKKVRLYVFGTVDPAYYGINYENLRDEEFTQPLPDSFYAISSRYIHSVKWARDIEPLDRVAHNIFIYRILPEKREAGRYRADEKTPDFTGKLARY